MAGAEADALSRKTFPYLYEPQPKTKYKTTEEAVEAMLTDDQKLERGCKVLWSRVRDKKISNLTVKGNRVDEGLSRSWLLRAGKI